MRTSHLMMTKIRCVPTDLEPVCFRSCAEGKSGPTHHWTKNKTPEWGHHCHHQPDTPLWVVKSPYSTKQEKAFPCAICFSEKQAMSYICNKLSSVFHTRQNLGFKKINTKKKRDRQQKNKCLQVYIVPCCICITPSQSTDLDCDTSWHEVYWQNVFFFFSFFCKENKADLIKQMRFKKSCRG